MIPLEALAFRGILFLSSLHCVARIPSYIVMADTDNRQETFAFPNILSKTFCQFPK